MSISVNDRYLPLASIPARMSRDGVAGPNAKIYLPFYGLHFFSGEHYTFPNGTVAQDKSQFLSGVSKSDTFCKNAASCAA